jgi:hypothetical protein
MATMYYIGLDVHKKTIDYCVKDGSGRIYSRFNTRPTIRVGHVDENTPPSRGRRPWKRPSSRLGSTII